MTDDKQAHENIDYVRSVLQRAEQTTDSPAAILVLWAVISFFGFAIIDFAPRWTGLYWLVAGPMGGVLSAVLGYRAGRLTGQVSKREGALQLMHWAGLMIGILLIVPLLLTHVIAIDDFPRIVLLVIALSYYTAGVHGDRRMIPVSLVVVGGYLLTVFVRDLPYLWTITGAIVAGSLATAGFLAAAHARRAA